MQHLKRFGLISLTALCFGLWMAKITAQPVSNSLDLLEETQILKKKGLPALFERIEDKPELQLPKIHSQPYCTALSATKQDSCIQANLLGREIYTSLRVYEYKIQDLPLSQFSRAIKRLSVLRDKMWDTKRMGGVMLGDITNRIIFWHLVQRATDGPIAEIDQINTLRASYKDLIFDWKTVAQAASEETNRSINYQTIENATTRLAKPYGPREEKLSLRYINIADQVSAVNFEEGKDVLDSLQNGAWGSFLHKQGAGACSTASYSLLLRYYLPLIKQMRLQPDFMNRVPAVAMKSPDASWVKKLVLQRIPQALGQKPMNCNEGISWQSFYRILLLVRIQRSDQSSYTKGSNSDFELLFP